MSLTQHAAIDVVEEIDRYYRLRPEEAADAKRKVALGAEIAAAFKGQDVSAIDVKHLVIQWRRPMDEGEPERIRVSTRPGGWDLRRLHDQNQRATEESRPARGCPDCGDSGRRTIIAVVQNRSLLRVERLVVACACGQGDGILVGGVTALKRAAAWKDLVEQGAATFQGLRVVAVFDVEPCFGKQALELLGAVGVGEVVERHVLDEIETSLRR